MSLTAFGLAGAAGPFMRSALMSPEGGMSEYTVRPLLSTHLYSAACACGAAMAAATTSAAPAIQAGQRRAATFACCDDAVEHRQVMRAPVRDRCRAEAAAVWWLLGCTLAQAFGGVNSAGRTRSKRG